MALKRRQTSLPWSPGAPGLPRRPSAAHPHQARPRDPVCAQAVRQVPRIPGTDLAGPLGGELEEEGKGGPLQDSAPGGSLGKSRPQLGTLQASLLAWCPVWAGVPGHRVGSWPFEVGEEQPGKSADS